MLNFLASLAFYGTLLTYLLAGVSILLSGVWIVDSILLNRQTKQWAYRMLNAPRSSNVAPWGRKFGR